MRQENNFFVDRRTTKTIFVMQGPLEGDVHDALVEALTRTIQHRHRRRKHKRRRLPQRIIPMPNKDKQFHEKWYPDRDLMDIPHPFRMVLASRPNGGKTTVIKNIILRAAEGERGFECIVVVHCDPESTREYDDLDGVILCGDIPAVEEFSGDQKTLVILEDLNYLDMSPVQKGRLERLYGYVSTHKNISCMLTAQDPFRIMATVRRCTNIFVIWNNHDQTMIKTLAAKTGISKERLTGIFDQHCPHVHDNLWIDLTSGTPVPFRKNGYTPLQVFPTSSEHGEVKN